MTDERLLRGYQAPHIYTWLNAGLRLIGKAVSTQAPLCRRGIRFPKSLLHTPLVTNVQVAETLGSCTIQRRIIMLISLISSVNFYHICCGAIFSKLFAQRMSVNDLPFV